MSDVAAARAPGRERLFLVGCLILLGAGWGLTQPLAKIAVEAGYRHFGLVFWQMALSSVVLGALTLSRGRGLRFGRGPVAIYLMIAVIGTILPNTASYQAMDHLPSGLMSVLLSLVPMVAFPVALALGNDQFSVTRVLGLMLGLGGVLLIVVPDAALPPGAAVAWVIVALVAPICYAFEGNLVAKFGLAGMDPVQALFGASVLGAVLAAPLAVGTGQFITPFQPYGLPEFAIIGSSVIHAAVYSMYVWMVGRAGPTFAVQVSYLVTGFGVMWAMVLLGERFSIFIWAALALMFAGIFLVQPKQSETEPARLQGADG